MSIQILDLSQIKMYVLHVGCCSPTFASEKCGAGMYPEYYKGVHGYEYRISDVRKSKGFSLVEGSTIGESGNGCGVEN